LMVNFVLASKPWLAYFWQPTNRWQNR
jgi:hypothetical protein